MINRCHSMFVFWGIICLGQFCALVYGAGRDNSVSWNEILHDSRDGFYRNPGWGTSAPYRTGAVVSGTTVRLRIRTAVNDLTGCFIRGWDNESSTEIMTVMSVVSSDGTYDYWQGQVTFNKAVDYYYAFKLVDGSSEDWYQDDAGQDGGIGETTDTHQYTYDYSIVWHRSDFTTPAWHTRAVIYQIMTDGFYDGNPSNNPAGNGLSGDVCWWEWDQNGTSATSPGTGRSWVRKRTWGQTRTGGNAFYGGDFEGVRAKMSYLADLGVTAIYFNPWMESPDNHGYSVNDYKSVHPYYGVVDRRISFDSKTNIVVNSAVASLAVFDTMKMDMESRGIRVISDMVLNHCGAQSYFFQRFEHILPNWQIYDVYPNQAGAYESQTSPWYNWFKFTTWNHEYQCWWGYSNLPQIQYINSTALYDLVSGPSSVFDFWNSHGVYGYRLDVNNEFADGNQTRTVNREIRNKVKALNPGAVVIAENWGRANLWLAGDMCDGTMNYRFRAAAVDWINGIASTEQMNRRLLNIQEDYPVPAQYASWTLLGSHDTERIRTVLGTADKQKLAAIFQFTQTGPPVVWAGDELGMTGGADPDNRRSMDWTLATESNDILKLYKMLSLVRRTYTPLAEGWMTPLLASGDIYAYGREVSAGGYVADAVIILNRAASAVTVTVDIRAMPGLAAGETLKDVLTGSFYTISPYRNLSLTIPSYKGVVLVNPITDLDSDSDVDIEDFKLFTQQWKNNSCAGPGWCSGSDLNKDGIVDIQDLARWIEEWLWNRSA